LLRRQQLLLAAAGAESEAEFYRRAAAQAEISRLRTERAAVEQEIAASLGGGHSEERMAQLLSEKNLEQRELEVIKARQDAFDRLNRSAQRRGEMNEQLKMLAENRQLAHLRVELGIVEKRLQEAVDRWRVLTTCSIMLKAVRDYYEREHQPQALREASLHLQRLTSGRYTRVWTPLGEHALRIDDEQGRSLNVEVLSRGTREQLFLALRLALASAYARRGDALPLVLDDVLVNFDVGRARAAATVLRDFARTGHQVLVFTCHEHIARLFRNLKADVRQLPDRLQSHEESAPARRARRSRPEAPLEIEPEPAPLSQPEEIEVAEVAVEAAPVEPVPAETRLEVPPPYVPAPVPAAEPLRRPPQIPDPHFRQVRRSDWSAEEFEGELADRVRHGGSAQGWDREVHSDFDDGFAASDDAEAAA
jgi:hypothetical protein